MTRGEKVGEGLRVVIETPCEHDEVIRHAQDCLGGSRRVLSEGEYSEVEFAECCEINGEQLTNPFGPLLKGNGEWSEWRLPPGRYLVIPLDALSSRKAPQ